MPSSDPGLRRVCIHAGADTLDLALPTGVPVTTLIPAIVDILRGRSGGLPDDVVVSRYRLSRPGEPALPRSTTLAQNDIRDGAVLVLNQSTVELPGRGHHDVAEAMVAALEPTAYPHRNSNADQLLGAVVASCLASTGILVLVRNAFDTSATRYTGSTAGAAALASVAALSMATIAHRTYRDRIAGLTMVLIATAFAAMSGLLAVPGVPGAANVLLAGTAAAVTSVLALHITGCDRVALTSIASFAMITAVAALAGMLTTAPAHAVGSLSALVSLGLLEVSPRLAILLAGLSPTLTTSLDPDIEGELADADNLAAKATRADNWLTSLLAAFSSSAVAGAIVAALARKPEGIACAVVISALLLLRARSVDRRKRLMFVISGSALFATTFTVTATHTPHHGPCVAAVTAVLAAAAIYLGSAAPTMQLSPVIRRSVELVECTAWAALVPMTCWVCGAFSVVRGLHLI